MAGSTTNRPIPSIPLRLWSWLRANLFYNWLATATTVLIAYLLVKVLIFTVDWAFLSATFVGDSRDACTTDGACWAFINARAGQFFYGYYPIDWRWRINLSLVLFFVALVPVFWESMPWRKWCFIGTLCYPIIAYVLIFGAGILPGLVNVRDLGGFALTIILSTTGIVLSLPLGILLALGRRSKMTIISAFCVGFIEFFRGVPLISLLFIASAVLAYFLPQGISFDLLLRVIVMIVLFSAAYLAEVIRGGIQSLSTGQTEGAASLGLGYWQTTFLIVLPQAIKVSIPSIVNSFIALIKDTTLVVVIGMADPLGVGRSALADLKWKGLSHEMYFFLALVFWVICFGISRYSDRLEKRLDTGH